MSVFRRPFRQSENTILFRSLIALLAALTVIAIGPGRSLASPGGAQPPALTKSIELRAQGITVHFPDTWAEVQSQFINAHELQRASAGSQLTTRTANAPRILITTEEARDHAYALRRLSEIALEAASAPHVFLNVGGWPAVQRRQTLPVEQPESVPAPATNETYDRFTTAIAAGSVVVRLEGFLPSSTGSLQAIADEMLAIGGGLSLVSTGDPTQVQQEIEALKAGHQSSLQTMSPGVSVALSSDSASGNVITSSLSDPELNIRVNNSTTHDSEIEVAVSTNGRNIVIGNNSRDWAFSTNGGQTWTFGGALAQPAGFFAVNGDPSLAFGRSGAFYYAFIGYPDTDASAARDECSTAIDVSTNGGQSFTFRANAVYCNDGGTICFPDQEHIAADRFNAAAGGGDQVYSVWRHFTGGTCLNSAAGPVASIVCSNDGGQNWTGVATIDGGGDRPRIAVGQDGAVHVVYRAGGSIMYRRYSSCTSGLVPAGPPVPVAAVPGDGSYCPMPGIDRCSSPFASSQTVAVDDTDAAHIYVAYSLNTVALSNEEIRVQDSTDGGMSFPPARTVTINNGVVSRRYMPWVCSVGGAAYVGWYDRRNATGADNSLTDYFVGSASLDAGGDLMPGTEFKISRVSDSACASGWITDGTGGNQNCVPRATGDSETCTVQPQLAGKCCQVALNGNNCPAGMGSSNACDFSDGGCPAGEACQTGNGCPKYGDYSGITCGAGRFYAAWASATSPSTITPPSGNIDVFMDQKLVCCVPQIQVPGSVTLSDTCVGSSSTATLQVCNTGKEDLEVDSITSNNTQFAVTTPSSGYPVVISPDFCFPFEVKFTPTSTGAKTATLTITSNDTVNPSVQVTAAGSGIDKDIDTVIADNGSFGDVCRDTFKDLPLTIHNSGGCDLTVSNITSSAAEFQVASTMSFPVVVAHGTSLQVPIRLAPTTLGAKAGNITITSNDPDTPVKVVPVTGTTPPGDIRVTGSTDFGDVCAGTLAEKTLSVCNVGKCNLNVTSVAFEPPCADFTLVNNPFPAPVSPDSCDDVVIRFTPTSAGPKSCTLVIRSDDPDTPVISKTVTANTPLSMIDVPPDQGFPPTVISSVGACQTGQPFPVSNTGTCNLSITDFAITANTDEFSLSGLPSFPIILEPGHIAGEGDLQTVFAPDLLGRARAGTLNVTYVSDPITGATTNVSRALCGEGVRTGARVLVTAGGVPMASVEQIKLSRINANRNKNLLDTVDNARNLTLQSVAPAPPCAAFQYHREYSTVSNPIQLLPGSYQVTVTAVVNGKRKHKSVGFDVTTCGFNPAIVVNF
ncbi:MAG TPA: choice-of-anchor D domain-containing protein [Candidatus Polarisedimenticolia bacterium]|jgi:hypothetical protein